MKKENFDKANSLLCSIQICKDAVKDYESAIGWIDRFGDNNIDVTFGRVTIGMPRELIRGVLEYGRRKGLDKIQELEKEFDDI